MFIYIYRVGKVKRWSHLLIHNCYCYSPLHGACSELLDCQIILVCIEPWMSLPWFFIFLIIYYIYIIISKCYPGWLPSETSWPSMGYSSFVWEDPPNFISVGLAGGVVDTEPLVCVWDCSGGVGHCSELVLACLGLGDLFSFWGLLKKSVMSTMLSSVSVSRSSRVRVFFFGYGELDLGSESKFLATLASDDVASCSVSLFSSSLLEFPKEGGVMDSIGGIFSLLELRQSDSSKYLGLYSCSVGLGHGPESEVTLISLFLGVKTPGSFGGKLFPFFGWFLPWVELFCPLLSILYQCMVSRLCFNFQNQKHSIFW